MNIISSLWIGSKLTRLEIYCIKSFLKLGYDFHLYVYSHIDNIPDGTIIMNANEIIDEDDIFFLNGSLATFSDLFRYKLLYEVGGIWTDLDMIALKRFDFEEPFIFSSERTIQKGAYKLEAPYVTHIGILKAPPKSEFYKELYEICVEIQDKGKNKETIRYMRVLRDLVKKYQYEKYVRPPSDFCNLNWWDTKDVFFKNDFRIKYGVEPKTKEELLSQSYTIHFWRSLATNKYKLDLNKIYNKNSFWELLLSKVDEMDFIIAIPTYNRPEIFKQTTMAFLERHNVPKKNVLLFLKDKEQLKKYENIDYQKILTNSHGMMKTRNYLQKYFRQSEYENVLYLDDDIADLYDYDKPLDDFICLINKMIKDLEQRKLYIAGISPYDNTFYLKRTSTTTLKNICGCFRLERIRRDTDIILTPVGQFEDMFFSCKHFLRDGGLLRYNWIYPKTKFFNDIGGMNESLGGMTERQKEMEINKDIMLELFPKMLKPILKKTGWDLRLNHHYKI